MNTEYNYLITLTHGNTLLKVAVKFDGLTHEEEEALKYWAEPEEQEWILAQLPNYVSSIGHVVEVVKIFAILKI
jgi:hypothetical protein